MSKPLAVFVRSLIVALLVIAGHEHANIDASVPLLTNFLPESTFVAEDMCVSSYEDFLEYDWKRKACVGGAFIVVKGDDVVLLKTTGVKSRRTNEPVTEHSVFRIGSLSKGFAGILAGMLFDEGLVDWQDRIVECMPDFRMSTPEATETINVENILSHSTGMIRHAYTNLIEEGRSIEQIAAEFDEVPVVGTIGKSYAYQNAAYSLIEKIAETSADASYQELLSSQIFERLHMKDASCSYEGITESGDLAYPHSYNGRQARVTKKYYNSVSSGGVNASISDMGQWLKLLLGNYPHIMDEDALDEVFTPRVNTRRDRRYYNRWPGFQDSHYAIGWRVIELDDRTLVHHGGYVNGYRSEIAIDRENKIAICALFNSPCSYASKVVPNFFEFYDNCASSTAAP